MRTKERCACLIVSQSFISRFPFFRLAVLSPQLYITCHLNAVPVTDAEAPNKACTSINGRQVVFSSFVSNMLVQQESM